MSVFGNQRTLAGLDTLTNLENLECTLKPTEIDSISPLTRLQDLHLTVNGLIRQNFMAPLYHLTYLKVDTYNPPPISWQTTMTRLNYLDLTNCAIMMEDLQQMTALTNLTQLQVNFPPRGAPVLFTMTRLQRIQFTPRISVTEFTRTIDEEITALSAVNNKLIFIFVHYMQEYNQRI
jgi:hypothetical protein